MPGSDRGPREIRGAGRKIEMGPGMRSNLAWLLARYKAPPRCVVVSTAPLLHTWAGVMLEGKYILGPQEAISEAGRL